MKLDFMKLCAGLLVSVSVTGILTNSAEAQSNRGGRYCPPNVAYRPVVVFPGYGTNLSVNRITPFGYGINYGYSSFYPSVPFYNQYGVGYGIGMPRGASWGGGGMPRGASWGGGGMPRGASWGGGGNPPGASWGGGRGF